MFIVGRLLLGIGGVVVGAIGPVSSKGEARIRRVLTYVQVLVAELAYPSKYFMIIGRSRDLLVIRSKSNCDRPVQYSILNGLVYNIRKPKPTHYNTY